MITNNTFIENRRFKIGWGILVILTALMTMNHFALIFFMDDPVLFIGYTAFNLYGLITILIPFRKGELWAWFTTWILPVGLALPALSDANIAAFYIGFSVVCVLGLLLTRPDFFTNRLG